MLNYQLCKEFPALTPYDVDEKPFSDVIDLYSDVRTLQINAEKRNPSVSNGPRIIRRKAGDDWF